MSRCPGRRDGYLGRADSILEGRRPLGLVSNVASWNYPFSVLLLNVLVQVLAGMLWSRDPARDNALLRSQGTSREAEATARELGRLPYSRSSFERVGHAVGEAYVSQHQHVEQLLIEALPSAGEVHSVSAALDRVTIPMEEPRPRPRGRPRKDAPPHPGGGVIRMGATPAATLFGSE